MPLWSSFAKGRQKIANNVNAAALTGCIDAACRGLCKTHDLLFLAADVELESKAYHGSARLFSSTFVSSEVALGFLSACLQIKQSKLRSIRPSTFNKPT